MAVTVRAASSADGLALAALNAHVHGLHVAARPDFFQATAETEVAAWLGARADAADSRVWIAEDGRAPVGYVLVFFHERPARPFTHARRWCEIDQIAVAPEGRRRGTARALIDAALAEARRRGIRDVELSAWSFNADAHAVFQRLGFRPKMIWFERILPA